MSSGMTEDRKGVTISREAWNALRELQVIFDAETYSETILYLREYMASEERKLKQR